MVIVLYTVAVWPTKNWVTTPSLGTLVGLVCKLALDLEDLGSNLCSVTKLLGWPSQYLSALPTSQSCCGDKCRRGIMYTVLSFLGEGGIKMIKINKWMRPEFIFTNQHSMCALHRLYRHRTLLVNNGISYICIHWCSRMQFNVLIAWVSILILFPISFWKSQNILQAFEKGTWIC